MTSPRSVWFGLPRSNNSSPWLAALAVMLISGPAQAQSTSAGSPNAVIRETRVTPDTSRPPTAADTANPQRTDSAASAGRPAATPAPPPPAPLDSALGAACAGAAGGFSDLLLVRFQPGTTPAERTAVAQEVGGTLVGSSEHTAPGSWFIRAPSAADVRSVADQLIQLTPVVEVGSPRCPS